MYKSSIVEILKTFSDEDFKKFESFLKSPYHNTISNVTKLFLTIKKYSPEFDNPELSNENVWRELFPDKIYNYGIMKNLIHELNKLGLNFITIETFSRQSLAKDTAAIYALILRNLTKLTVNKIRETERKTVNNPDYIDESGFTDYYFELFKISFMKEFYFAENRVEVLTETEINKTSSYLVYSFLIYLYKNYNNIVSRSLSRNYSTENNLTEILLNAIDPSVTEKLLNASKSDSIKDHNVLKVFSDMSNAFMNKKEVSYYFEFKKSFLENIDLFSKVDKRDLFICLLNSIDHKSFSELDIYNERFEVFNEFSKSGAFIWGNGVLYPSDFLLYIWMAFDADKFSEIKSFAGKFMEKLPADNRAFAFRISDALIQFGNGNFSEVLEFIAGEPTESFVIKIRLRQVKVKCLYEINDFESFESEKNSVYHFLKNNKMLSETVKNSIEMLYKWIFKMFRLRENFDPAEFNLLQKEISEFYKSKSTWFHQKLKEFEKA